MKTVAQRLYDYINDQENSEFITRSGITISAPDEDMLQAEFIFIDTEDTYLSVIFDCDRSAFVKQLGISSIQDIHTLAPGKLTELYYEGLAEMLSIVAVECKYFMSFKKAGNSTVAENDRGIKHTVPMQEKLETPDQFTAYALQYYTLMECTKNQQN